MNNVRVQYRLVKFFAVCSISMLSMSCFAQQKKPGEPFRTHSSVAVVLSHALVFEGSNEAGEKEFLSLPSWGLEYYYWFHPKWAIGLQTDIIIEKFKVEQKSAHGTEEESIERNYPVAPAVMSVFKPSRHWSFALGLGEEFAKGDNFFLTRIGIEYSEELPKRWEVFGVISYDIKWNGYDDCILGFGIAESFGK